MDKIRIGTRGSKLALKQVALVQEALSRACSDIVTELVILSTRGDQVQDRPLSELGDKGVFASELERALLVGQIDLAVHSAKDLPMKLADGLAIAAVLPRADVRDVLVVPKGGRMPVVRQSVCEKQETADTDALAGQNRVEPETAAGQIFRLGTGSRRRQLLAGKLWENVVCEEIRGNVDTRLRKLREGSYDGIILAKAGLDRLGSNPEWDRAFDFYPLSPERFLPAACQGIIAVEAVEGTEAAAICGKIADEETMLCYLTEREALAQLSADCSEAAAAWCRVVMDEQSRETVCMVENVSEVVCRSDGADLETAYAAPGEGFDAARAAGRLFLDVMYADSRVKVTGLVSTEEGRRLARVAAHRIKGGEGKVYLAGGGCGGAELLTLKAIRALQSCDAVVYDSLVSEELLHWTRSDCEKIYVGKRHGCHSMRQSEINTLLVEKAREGKTVVRLKGGDPYVFGRGGEEFMAVRDAGICCEEIPGITSAIAVPAAAGIPVTHRGLSDSVTVVTGTVAETGGRGELKLDFQTLARLEGTLVILMGMHHLAEIVTGLMAAGKERNTPCAIVMEGTTERQRVLRAPLFEVAARAAEQGFTSPAVIVVGGVAKLELMTEKEDCAWAEKEIYDRLPLAGITVGVTGTPRFADRLSRVLRERGAQTWDMSFMKVMPTQETLPDFAGYGWLVFTSPNGVRVFLDKMRRGRRDLRTLVNNKIAVIGPGTAAVLQEAGLYADYMPQVYDAAHLARGLSDIIMAGQVKEGTGGAELCRDAENESSGGQRGCNLKESVGADGKSRKEESAGADERCGKAFPPSVLLLRAKQGSEILSGIFRERKIPCEAYPLYELGVQEEKRDAVSAKEPDYIVFGSAMGARAYFEGLEKKGIQNKKSRYVCIGEWCAEEVKKYAAQPPLVAAESSVEGIAACLCGETFGRNP